MHGLIFRTVEAFVSDCFGRAVWNGALRHAELPFQTFEAMLDYDAAFLPKVLDACAVALDRSVHTLLEDVGTYLATHANHAAVKRLMRFGGQSFVELVYSLDDLPGRVRLAVDGLELPKISVREPAPHCFEVTCSGEPKEFAFVLIGLLRAMADDYGTLAVVEHDIDPTGAVTLRIDVVDVSFSNDQGFTLAPTFEEATV